MIDSMFQSGTDAALDDQIARPAPFKPEEPGASLGGLLAAPFRGVASGSTKSAAFAAEIAGAFGDVAGAGGFNAGGMFSLPTEDERKQQEAARARLLAQGPQYSNPAGDELRQRAKDVMPDPATTHASEQAVAGLFEFAAQAVTYAAGAGPLAAPLLGADVALAEADKLKQQGVDLATRAKAGAVAGAVAGASIALPVAGRTVAQTAGLVAVGGPGGFIAQNVAEKAILENAGYQQIADQYDPLDPVGLVLSTVVPAGFGAVAMRGARRQAAPGTPLPDLAPAARVKLRFDDARLDDYAIAAAQREGIPAEALLAIKNAGERSNSTQTSPVGAKGVMQFMPETWKAYGRGDITDPVNSIDAGARFMKDLLLQYDGNVDAAIAHYNGGGRAGRAVMEGRPPPAAETQGYLQRTQQFMRDRGTQDAARTAVASDPDAVAAARVRQTTQQLDSYRLTDDVDLAGMTRHQEAVERAHEQMAQGEPVSVTDLLMLESVRAARLLDEQIAGLEAARATQLPIAGNLAEAGDVRGLRAEISRLESQRPDDGEATIKGRARDLQQSEGLSYKRALSAAEKDVANQLATHDAQITRLRGQIDQNAVAQRATEEVGRLDQAIGGLREQRAQLDAPVGTPQRLASAIVEAFADRYRQQQPVIGAASRRRAAAPAPAEAAGSARPAAQEAGAVAAREPGQPSQPGGEAASVRGQPGSQALDAPTSAALDANPDLMVQLEGMDKPVRASELLEQVRQEAEADAQEATFLQTAVNCLLHSA